MKYPPRDDDAPHGIATRLRELAIKCTRIGNRSNDKNTATELEGVGVELALEATKIDDLFNYIEKAASWRLQFLRSA